MVWPCGGEITNAAFLPNSQEDLQGYGIIKLRFSQRYRDLGPSVKRKVEGFARVRGLVKRKEEKTSWAKWLKEKSIMEGSVLVWEMRKDERGSSIETCTLFPVFIALKST